MIDIQDVAKKLQKHQKKTQKKEQRIKKILTFAPF